jgi:hypothetical protein
LIFQCIDINSYHKDLEQSGEHGTTNRYNRITVTDFKDMEMGGESDKDFKAQ